MEVLVNSKHQQTSFIGNPATAKTPTNNRETPGHLSPGLRVRGDQICHPYKDGFTGGSLQPKTFI